jgi:transposase
MSQTVLYQIFNIRGYDYRRTSVENGRGVITIQAKRENLKCSHCGSSKVICHGVVERDFKHLPVGNKPTILRVGIPRVECLDCSLWRQVDVAFAEARRTYTRAFERYVLDLSQDMTIGDIARHLRVGWDMIKDIQKRNLQRRFRKPKLKHLKEIAIDEICIGRGHRYVTLVLDLVSGAVVFVGKGKGADALRPFWKRLRASRAKIKAVATDMSSAYIKAVRENLEGVVHVFDRFHVVKLVNEKLSQLRRSLFHQATAEGKTILKGTRWLLLKNPENLEPAKNEPARLKEALEMNQPLATAYYMKEELREFWEQENKRAARRHLKSWLRRARASGIRILQKLADTLETHQQGLLAWYKHPISTGPLEGTNNKIKTMQRQHYGFRDREFFDLKIYALHECRYALVG